MHVSVEESNRALEILKSSIPEGAKNDIGKVDLVRLGQDFCKCTYAGGQGEEGINERVSDYIDYLLLANPSLGIVMRESLKIPDQQVAMFASARWWEQGLPVIRLGHKRAAALMATNISEANVEHIKPPFWAFFIELPDGLLSLKSHTGEDVKATGVLVHVMNIKGMMLHSGEMIEEDTYRWRWLAITGTSLVQWQLNRKVEELAGFNIRDNQWEGVGIPLEDYDERLALVVGRLICSVCLMMSDPTNIRRKTEPVLRHKSGKRPAKGSPNYEVYSVETPIKVDVRQAVTAYLRGERNSPSVRKLVRGHFKPNLSARIGRLVWIHPYARGGDESDPIMQGIYKLEES